MALGTILTSYSICYPFRGAMRITSPFGTRYIQLENYTSNFHEGIDIVGVGDTTVVAVTSGTVDRVQPASDGSSFGNRVWVRNDDGTSCVYAHLKSFLCTPGQRIKCKTPIGMMGSSGAATGAHLHLGVFNNPNAKYNNKQLIDPAIYLKITYDTKNLTGKYLDGNGYATSHSKVYKNYDDVKNNNPDVTNYQSAYVEAEKEDNNVYAASATEIYEAVENSERNLDILYGRRYRIIISDGDGNDLDVSSLRCTFDIIKSWTNNSETSTISIYNLSSETENRIIQTGKTVFVEAGYASKWAYGKIYVGSIIQCLRSKENGTDFVLTIVMGDATIFNVQSVLGVTVNSNNNLRKVISEVVNKSGNITERNYGLSLGKITNKSDQIELPRGKVLFGRSSKLLEQISNTLGSTVYIENGVVNLVSLEEVESDEIFDISPSSGLIGNPVQSDNGVSLTCLLNPQFKLNSLFRIDNSLVQTQRYSLGESLIPLSTQGIYRVIKITYTGDTRGKKWFTKIEAISQIGTLPDIAFNGYSNVL